MESLKKVLVGLSGGVDSSVAALLLKEQGYHVECAFIVPWSPPWLPCTWREERLDAMRVAAHLGIPFHTVDLSREYERDVTNYFVREYGAGRTPNPDIMCNKHIKFGAFFSWAIERGFDHVATGHYARIHTKQDGTHALLAGSDPLKDQSYFLWTLTQEHLGRVLFPVGNFEKQHVRVIAAKAKIPTAKKKDSQGICFLGNVDMKDFLKHYFPEKPGAVLNESGERIGSHMGAVFYTLGERHGFVVTSTTPHQQPLYIVGKNMEDNTITVAPRALADLHGATSVLIKDANWLSGAAASVDAVYGARYRYRQKRIDSHFERRGESFVVHFNQPQMYVATGQSIVLYDKEECVGGGVIENLL